MKQKLLNECYRVFVSGNVECDQEDCEKYNYIGPLALTNECYIYQEIDL